MSNSLTYGKDFIKEWVTSKKDEISNILDVGAGEGTYYKLLHDIKDFDFFAIEIWGPYIEKYLRTKPESYKNIFDIDIRGFMFKSDIYDLIIFGDILEHLKKKEAIQIIERAKQACKYFIISIPISHCPQNMEHGNPYQEHLHQYDCIEVIESFGPFIEMKDYFCEIGRHGKPLNRKFYLGVFIGEGKLTTNNK